MGILAFILFFHLGAAPIYILDEAKNAQCAREMLQRKDWIVPTFNGELRTDKPILHYYFMIISYKIFGVNEFAARFFSAVLGCLTVTVTFLFTRRFINATAAFCTSLVLFSSTQFLFEFRMSVPDPYLIFFITAGLITAYTYLQENKLTYLLIASLCFALATLAKGPVALALPGLCLLIWVLVKKKWRLVFSWKLLVAVSIIMIVTLPWYIAVHNATHGAWTKGFFLEHNLNRFSEPQEGHGGFFLLPLAFILVGLLPFTTFAGEVMKSRRNLFSVDFVKFSGIVVLIFLLFFSIASTKLPNYPMPCYPFIAVVLGYYLSNLLDNKLSFKSYPLYILIVFTFILPIAAYFAIASEKEVAEVRSVVLMLIATPVLFIVVFFLWKKLSNYNKIIAIASGFSLFNILALHIIYPVLYKQNPVAKTIGEIKKHNIVYAYKMYNPGYNFYLPATIKRLYDTDTLREAMRNNPDVIVISRQENDLELQQLNLGKIAQHHDLFESPTTVLYVAKSKP